MCVNFPGSDARLFYSNANLLVSPGTVSFFIRTTQNVQRRVLTVNNSGISNGINIDLMVGGTLTAQTRTSASGIRSTVNGASVVNDGGWHHVAYTYQTGSGLPNELFVNSASEGSANNSAVWSYSGASGMACGQCTSPSSCPGGASGGLVGDMAHVALYSGILPAAAITALRFFRPTVVRKSGLIMYAPLAGRTLDIYGVTPTPTGSPAVASDSPRVF